MPTPISCLVGLVSSISESVCEVQDNNKLKSKTSFSLCAVGLRLTYSLGKKVYETADKRYQDHKNKLEDGENILPRPWVGEDMR